YHVVVACAFCYAKEKAYFFHLVNERFPGFATVFSSDELALPAHINLVGILAIENDFLHHRGIFHQVKPLRPFLFFALGRLEQKSVFNSSLTSGPNFCWSVRVHSHYVGARTKSTPITPLGLPV